MAAGDQGTAWEMLGHLGWLLLIVAAASGRLRILRLWLLAAAVAFAVSALATRDFWGVAWAVVLAAITALQLGGALLRGRRAVFTPEERAMIATLPGLGKAEARHLLDQGFWLDAKPGDVLTRAGEPIANLCYLSAGGARVSSEGVVVAEVTGGSFIGEVTVLSGGPAIGTVEIDRPSRLWCASATALRAYADQHDDVRRALEAAFRQALSEKLVASNRRATGTG